MMITFLKTNARWLTAGGLLSFSSAYGQTFFISIFAGQIMAEFSLSDGQWGGLYSLGTTASAILMIWAGGLTDRFRVTALGSVILGLLALVCLAMSQVSAVWMLPFVIFGLRFTGQGMISHIAVVAMARWYSKARGKAIAIASLGFSLGEALLPIIFVSLLVVLPWRSLWIIAALFTLLTIPILRFLLTKERTTQSVVEKTQSVGLAGRHWTRAQVLKHGLFWMLVPLVIAPGTFSTALFFQQVHLSGTKGWEHAYFVALFPIYTLSSILAMLVYGWAIDRWDAKRFMPIFTLPMALAFVVFGLGDSLGVAAIGFIFMGLMQGGGATLSGAFWAEMYGTKHLGSIKALATSLMVFGSALGPLVTGVLIDTGLNFEDQMLGIALYICLASLLAFVGLRSANSPNAAA